MKNSIMLVCLGVLFVSCSKELDPPVPGSSQELLHSVDTIMEYQDIPALSLLVFNSDGVKKTVVKGDASVGEALTEEHLFLMASVSKMVTAAALLKLYDEKKFKLEDNINKYLPFSVSHPGFPSDSITFKMLLAHTSSIADGSVLDSQYYYGKDSPVKLGDFLKSYFTLGDTNYNAVQNFHNAKPGTVHNYSNVGSALIGYLVEVIAKKDFAEYCKEELFTPLGMSNTSWKLEGITAPIASPHDFDNELKKLEHFTFTDYPNGGLRSNAQEFCAFLQGILDGKVLSKATMDLMFSPQISSIDNEVGLHSFLMLPNHNVWGHDGEENGASTIVGFNPKTKVGAIILTNIGGAELEGILDVAYRFGINN